MDVHAILKEMSSKVLGDKKSNKSIHSLKNSAFLNMHHRINFLPWDQISWDNYLCNDCNSLQKFRYFVAWSEIKNVFSFSLIVPHYNQPLLLHCLLIWVYRQLWKRGSTFSIVIAMLAVNNNMLQWCTEWLDN